MVFCGAVVVAFSVYAFSNPKQDFEIVKQFKIFSDIISEINDYYVDEPDIKKMVDAGINSMLASLDPYTNYIREEDMDDF